MAAIRVHFLGGPLDGCTEVLQLPISVPPVEVTMECKSEGRTAEATYERTLEVGLKGRVYRWKGEP